MYGAVSSQVVPGPQVSRVGKVMHSVSPIRDVVGA